MSQKATLGLVNSLPFKRVVRAATTANGTLSTAYANGSTVDGVTLATGDRILLKNQTTGADNGIYTVNASGAPTRALDADSSLKLVSLEVRVSEGTANADTEWYTTNDATITVGTTALVFVQSASSGLKSNLTASANPTATDDSAAGYAAGSTWYNTVNETRWYCADATASAAVWLKLAIDGHRSYTSGRYYARTRGVTRGTGALALGDAFYGLLFEVKELVTIDRLAAMVNTGVASSNIKMAMYDARAATWVRKASTGAVDTSTSSTSVTGTLNEGSSVIIQPGIYGLGCVADPAAIANLVIANNNSMALAEDIGGSSMSNLVGSASNIIGFTKTSSGMYAAGCPSTIDMSNLATAGANVNCPIIGFRVL
jgi:phage-related tail fiber protein